MIKKLRMKLIIASMMSLLAVLLIIEGIAGALNYNRIVAETDHLSFHMNPDIFRYCLTVKGKCSQQIQERLPELILLMR